MATIKTFKDSFSQLLTYSFTEREKDQLFYLLLEHYADLSRLSVLTSPEEEMDSDAELSIRAAINQLNAGVPIQYVTNIAYFRELELTVDSNVLIPRPETEELVQLFFDHEVNRVNVIDLGTGSGCIPLCIKQETPIHSVTGIDLSEGALRTAIANSKRLGLDVDFHLLSMSESFEQLGSFDVIISNPPYIGLDEKEELEAHVIKHEPSMALFSTTSDPIYFYRCIVDRSLESLSTGGRIYLELHENYAEPTKELFLSPLFKDVEIFLDLQGKQRFLRAVKA